MAAAFFGHRDGRLRAALPVQTGHDRPGLPADEMAGSAEEPPGRLWLHAGKAAISCLINVDATVPVCCGTFATVLSSVLLMNFCLKVTRWSIAQGLAYCRSSLLGYSFFFCWFRV